MAHLALAGIGSSASAPSRQRSESIAFQFHMVFFSHESGRSIAIDPQMFV